jgi:hypothetical protein
MAVAKHKPSVFESRNQTQGRLCSLEDGRELEKFDRQAGHTYLPMDVYVDPTTIAEHFQASSISARWSRIHRNPC